jgi:hypothetical protein
MDDLHTFVFGRSFEFINFGKIPEFNTVAGKGFGVGSVHGILKIAKNTARMRKYPVADKISDILKRCQSSAYQ